MPYLIQNDFKRAIQLGNLNQVIGSDYSIINSWLLAAQEKASSYLIQKYDTSNEFTETVKWIKSNPYKAANRVYLDAAVYNPALNYAIGDVCIYQNNFYTATSNSVGITFNPANWSTPIPQYTLYFGAYPNPPFDVYGYYNKGDRVFWKNNVYTATNPTAQTNDAYVLQYGTFNNIPLRNYFPDAPQQTQWSSGVAYIIPANIDITNTAYWTQGDNRGQQMVQTVINLVLYYAHSRISPTSVPEHIKTNYMESINWLKDACDGIITPNLSKVQPNRGNKIRFGGNIRNNNSY
ncbi:hypothetical protein [Mucilaginibacter sp. 10I4]|uniref:hypothetical protein n=1 Tax=Mucilaginibacter sp. 10I4 TaxID=3048580 RepID=UPI002B235CF8|nr:hypothetical protein [Mucilaginibacter sp. 10I4]MEB0262915.1 hypothetical protein [Mucilaginibacter sp. 10I4]